MKFFLKLKESIIEAPILHHPDPNKGYIVYTNTSDDACGSQLFQDHNGTELPIAFLLLTFLGNTKKMELHWNMGFYYAITKLNYYSPGSWYHSAKLSQATQQNYLMEKMQITRSTDGDWS